MEFNIIPLVNRGKSVKRSESLMSRFSFIFPSESEKLGDLMLQEFKKNDQSNGMCQCIIVWYIIYLYRNCDGAIIPKFWIVNRKSGH